MHLHKATCRSPSSFTSRPYTLSIFGVQPGGTRWLSHSTRAKSKRLLRCSWGAPDRKDLTKYCAEYIRYLRYLTKHWSIDYLFFIAFAAYTLSLKKQIAWRWNDGRNRLVKARNSCSACTTSFPFNCWILKPRSVLFLLFITLLTSSLSCMAFMSWSIVWDHTLNTFILRKNHCLLLSIGGWWTIETIVQ